MPGIDLDQYKRLKEKADTAKQSYDRAVGAREQLLTKLKEDFDCETTEEAEKKLKKLTAEADELEARYDQLLADWQEQWGEKV